MKKIYILIFLIILLFMMIIVYIKVNKKWQPINNQYITHIDVEGNAIIFHDIEISEIGYDVVYQFEKNEIESWFCLSSNNNSDRELVYGYIKKLDNIYDMNTALEYIKEEYPFYSRLEYFEELENDLGYTELYHVMDGNFNAYLLIYKEGSYLIESNKYLHSFVQFVNSDFHEYTDNTTFNKNVIVNVVEPYKEYKKIYEVRDLDGIILFSGEAYINHNDDIGGGTFILKDTEGRVMIEVTNHIAANRLNGNVVFVDFNFDGCTDILVLAEDDYIYNYKIFIWNDEEGLFELAESEIPIEYFNIQCTNIVNYSSNTYLDLGNVQELKWDGNKLLVIR